MTGCCWKQQSAIGGKTSYAFFEESQSRSVPPQFLAQLRQPEHTGGTRNFPSLLFFQQGNASSQLRCFRSLQISNQRSGVHIQT